MIEEKKITIQWLINWISKVLINNWTKSVLWTTYRYLIKIIYNLAYVLYLKIQKWEKSTDFSLMTNMVSRSKFLKKILKNEFYQPYTVPDQKITENLWPYKEINTATYPDTLPDGTPWPKISIITPSFNQGQYIKETILSVINQHYPDVEHILIDGGSTDSTMDVVARYRNHFTYIESKPDRGQSHALNKGFKQATGNILTWINSDDRLAPGALYAAALAFHCSKADVVAGVCQVFQGHTEIIHHVTSCADGPMPLEDLLDLENCWLAGQFFYQPEVLFTRDIWERAGGYVEETLYYSMDYELWVRFAASGAKMHVIGAPVAQFRMHDSQKTSTPDKYKPELFQTRERLKLRYNCKSDVPAGSENQYHKLRIVFFNDIGFYYGAGLAHRRLAEACALAGHEIIPIAVIEGDTPSNLTPDQVADRIAETKPDLVVVGNVHKTEADTKVIETIAVKFPTLFILHDQWLLTGKCPYVKNCISYLTGCNDTCDYTTEYPALAPECINSAYQTKRSMLGYKNNLRLAGNTSWTADWARNTIKQDPGITNYITPEKLVGTIRLGIDLSIFRPHDKKDSRRLLNLPQDKFIILTSAPRVDDYRKGAHHLMCALDLAGLDSVFIVFLGHANQTGLLSNTFYAGYVNSPRKLALYYSAADIFVGPSLQESFGQIFIEAAACGTPTVGYPAGGIPEAVMEGVTGFLAKSCDPKALADAISKLYHDEETRDRISKFSPLHIRNQFSYQSVYRHFIIALRTTGLLRRLRLYPVCKFSIIQPKLPATKFLQPLPNYRRWLSLARRLAEWIRRKYR